MAELDALTHFMLNVVRSSSLRRTICCSKKNANYGKISENQYKMNKNKLLIEKHPETVSSAKLSGPEFWYIFNLHSLPWARRFLTCFDGAINRSLARISFQSYTKFSCLNNSDQWAIDSTVKPCQKLLTPQFIIASWHQVYNRLV